ncbi:MAG: GNAT family N-acetyltransferase [Dinoroseobacter sp.]|nr:GNAT family N-acetyltransferase [Dinoroseobacter sp.]
MIGSGAGNRLPDLRTDRLVMRSLAPGDASDLARIAGDARVAPNIFMATVGWPEAEARAVIEKDRWQGKLMFRLAICLPDGTFIGSIGASAEPHIFYFLDPAHWGRGYAREVVSAFVPAVMAQFDLDWIGAEVFADNPVSGKVLEACSFARAGLGMATSRARLEPAPVLIYERRRAGKAAT